MDIEAGLVELRRIIEHDIKHQDYERVTKLADEYYKMVSGDEISDLLQRVVRRETEEEFNMRKTLTNSIIPPTLASTKLPFQKVVRKQPLVRKISWPEGNNDEKKLKLEKSISAYWGDASLEKYFEYAFVDYNYIDPNAFLITEFENFNSKKEKAKPYPFVATSEQCIMFQEHNNILEYLVVQLPIKMDFEGAQMDGYSYTMYLGNDTIKLTQTKEERSNLEEGIEIIQIGADYYMVSYFVPGASKVPARRFGYKRDAQTSGRTFVSCFHDIIPYLNKSLKNDSELDLSTAMTAFPQRLAYVASCKNCNRGKMPDDTKCPVCNGSGKEPFHNSTMDVITLDLPRDPSEIVDLEKLLVYKNPPIELLTFQKDYINELRANVFLMMFNKELYSKNEVAATATEKVLEIDNMNDTLRPFAQALSVMWAFVVTDIATFTDLGEEIILEHKYPNDFKFKSLVELMTELKTAKDAGASTSTIAAIEDDINELLYADRPEELNVIRIKNDLNPFRGYSEENVRLLISQGLTTKFNSVLWSNLESIFNELEQENEKDQLYLMDYKKIKEMVDVKVIEYIARMDAEDEAAVKKQQALFSEPTPPAE